VVQAQTGKMGGKHWIRPTRKIFTLPLFLFIPNTTSYPCTPHRTARLSKKDIIGKQWTEQLNIMN